MKKLLSVLLALCLALPLAALASVLSDTWQDASLSELQDAQLKIAERIGQLQAAEIPEGEAIVVQGSGTDIKTGIKVDFSPSRITFKGEGKVELTGGKYGVNMNAPNGLMVQNMEETGDLSALVEANGDWELTIEPIKMGASLPMSGSGPFVSDMFELPGPMIVTVSAKMTEGDNSSNFITKLHYEYKNINGWSGDSLTNEILWGKNESYGSDLILKPQNSKNRYFLSIYCQPGVEWSIAPKQ